MKFNARELKKRGFLPKTAQSNLLMKIERLEKELRKLQSKIEPLMFPSVLSKVEYDMLPANLQEYYTLDMEVNKVFELSVYKLKE